MHTCTVEEFPLTQKYDQIYHLASPVGPAGVLKYAGRMGSMILNDTMKVAEYAAQHKSKVIFISTSEVYGKDPGSDAQSEDIPKTVPHRITTRLEYGVAKLLTEICLHNFAKHHALKYNIIRPFNIVGVGQSSKAGFVLPRFVHAALTNQPITVFGDGTQVRTFTHVKDIVDGIVTLMNSEISGEIYNIGNPENQHSILDVAKTIKNMTNSQSPIVCVDPKQIYGPDYEEAWNKIPNITKISNHVGWKPKYSSNQIFQEIINDYKRMLAENKLRPNNETELIPPGAVLSIQNETV
ncbi:TPA: NAD-dependent epimerase/dehydratase family protein [Candidatus Woesearchaeota archaeon]|nr:NAD-dependent epimerase/dehydratase family protein [Candidatus Woesearchaeota archaeon]